MAESDILRYLNGIESQHSTKPRFMQHLTEILEKIDGATGAATDMPLAFFIEEAAGNQLDILGKLIGITRTITIPGSDYYGITVDDEQYRALLYAKIFANHWDGTIEMFHQIWNETLGKMMDASYIDNQDMTVDIIVNGIVSEFLLNLIPQGQLIPKPMGVRYTVINKLPEVSGSNSLYLGLALYGACTHTLGPIAMPDLDAEHYLVDELGNYLMDENSVVITD